MELKFSPDCQHALMQSCLYQLWKGGQRICRAENPTSMAKPPSEDLRSLPHVRKGQFPEPKESLGTTMAPSGKLFKLFSNFNSTGKLKVLEESGNEDTHTHTHPRLRASLTCNHSEKPRFWGASAFQEAKRDKSRKKGPSSQTLPHSRISDGEKGQNQPELFPIFYTPDFIFLSHSLC